MDALRRGFPLALVLVPLAALRLSGQTRPATAPAALASGSQVAPPPTDVSLVISKESRQRIPLAVPPAIAPLNPEIQSQVADPFHSTLVGDLGQSAPFLVADPALYPKGMRPPATREEADAWVLSSAQFLLDAAIQPQGNEVVITAQLHDLRTLKPVLSRKYTAEPRAARRVAHTLANDLVRWATGKPGPFLTKIAFSSDRDGGGAKEIYVMDFDGEGQRRITFGKSLALAPDWSKEGSRLAFQAYAKGGPGLYILGKDGGESRKIPVSTDLNASPSFSPDGRTIAYCGAVKGNPEIFTVGVDGSGLKRLTDSPAIDATPRFTPNGREIAFTSNRQGSPQIYLMDVEGANVRRLTFAGNWSDEAAFSPDGGRIAYACRNEGEFQICVQDLLSGRVVQVSTGPGAHENPTFSPDGSRLAWERMLGGSTQIVSASAVDGSGLKVLTTQGNNFSPSWSKALE